MPLGHDTLCGKTVAISGGTGGIGQALCRELAAHGAHILLLDRNAAKAQQCMQALRAEFPTLDIAHRAMDLTDIGTLQSGTHLKEFTFENVKFTDLKDTSILIGCKDEPLTIRMKNVTTEFVEEAAGMVPFTLNENTYTTIIEE